MVSLVLPPRKQLVRIHEFLVAKCSRASKIKVPLNRKLVVSAIESIQQRLRTYSAIPPNGLAIYCGTYAVCDGGPRKHIVDFEPFRPINTTVFLCDDRFHVEALEELLQADRRFGFIVADGSGCLYGAVRGKAREVLHRFSVVLPKKSPHGGLSAQRFGRIREEKRRVYIQKVARDAAHVFIADNEMCVDGLVLAGAADIKNDLQKSDAFDPRLAAKVVATVDVSCGGEAGLNQAIRLSQEHLGSARAAQEQQLIDAYFDEAARDPGRVVRGIEATLEALDAGAVETLIVWEDLEASRVVLCDGRGRESVRFLRPAQEQGRAGFRDAGTGAPMRVVAREPMLEWLAEAYCQRGASLEFVSDGSARGAQFVRCCGGIGGILRWSLDVLSLEA
ncbi:translation termination factor eRF1 [Coemansia javaensis]|uniref:Translation termination factor eRF1 n=1 Tax=Coemansia javaensis TaxID=2761396 RepID=A0A9W8HL22_9FUNG|nr:translation termination factor eRF1 [Coemansia javaensis]